MSGDNNRRVVNPLLNASVTGGPIEDFIQNAVLLPAAEAPSAAPEGSNQEVDELGNIVTPVTQGFGETQLSTPEALALSNQVPQTTAEQNNFPSVLSSFSSYLQLGTSTEASQASPVPYALDTHLQQAPASTIQPIPLFPPNVQEFSPPLFNQPLPVPFNPPPIAQGPVNNYRRTSTKRPTYVPIPGLTSNIPTVPAAPLLPESVSLSPQCSHSPLTPFSVRRSPLQSRFANSANYYQPELSGYATPPQPPQHSQICTPPLIQPIAVQRPAEKYKVTSDSPFLQPVSPSELNLIDTGSASFNTTTSTTSPWPSSYHFEKSTPTLMSNVMSSVNEGGRVSPVQSMLFPPLHETEQNVLPGIEGHSYMYRPVYHHWFYKKELETKDIWTPFSMVDSLNLEKTYLSNDLGPDNIVATDGGRYDVNILRRERVSVYWTSTPNEVRRCSWFRKGILDSRYAPYEENVATKLEEEFKIAYESNVWNRKVELSTGETVVFHGPDVLVLFPQAQSPDAWGNTPNQARPRVVKRGMDEFHIEEGEPYKVDHLLFLVHGIGSVCDLKFRSVEEVVDEFRSISLQLVQAHYRSSCDKGEANRVEVLPISWHSKLHSDDTGVDKKLKGITLESIPKLRDFTNDTILDVLFYTSPIYCQTIISSVANELNKVYEIFKQRNPHFKGGVSLGGHSLGSLILFDILCHQHADNEKNDSASSESEDVVSALKPDPKQRKISRRISYMMSTMGTGQPQLNYPQLSFNPKHFFALGSPIGMFVTVRGLDTLGEQFSLPTCPAFFNIFHPYDPVAYRIESLVNPELAALKPVLIPHHKGRKRMHLELKETMARVGADLKQRLVDSMKSTWNSFYQFSLFKTQREPPNLEEEVDKVLQEQLIREEAQQEHTDDGAVEAEPTDLSLGMLNQGRRMDYVLQEAPLEFINEYIFALTSHVCYWESEDTMLLILKEIYNSLNISADNQIPQQTMTIERPPPSPNSSGVNDPFTMGVNPTLPMTSRPDIGPPPTGGFIRKQ